MCFVLHLGHIVLLTVELHALLWGIAMFFWRNEFQDPVGIWSGPTFPVSFIPSALLLVLAVEAMWFLCIPPRGQAFASNHTISHDFVFLLWHSILPLPWRNESQLAPFVEWSTSLVLLLSQCLPLDLTTRGLQYTFCAFVSLLHRTVFSWRAGAVAPSSLTRDTVCYVGNRRS